MTLEYAIRTPNVGRKSHLIIRESFPFAEDPQPTPNCPRANGFFPFPANESCQKFWDCREGNSYLQECPQGVIFDPAIAACVTPDQARRAECQAGKFLGFECPQYKPEE